MKTNRSASIAVKFTLLIVLLAQSISLTNAAIRTWDGGQDGYWTNRFNWNNDIAPLPGDLLVFPSVALRKTCTNNFPGLTAFSQIRIEGDNYHLKGNSVKITGSLIANPPPLGSATIDLPIAAEGTVQTWTMTNALSVLNLNGPIYLDFTGPELEDLNLDIAGILNVNGHIGSDDHVRIQKFGAGTVRLSEPTNSLHGALAVYEGTLRIDGAFPNAYAYVVRNGTLAGSGPVHFIDTGSGATVSPGSSGPGLFRVLHSVSLDSNDGEPSYEGPANFLVDLNNSGPGTGYDQIELNGQLHLYDCNLKVSIGAPLVLGQNFTILNNLDESEMVTGEFNDLPEGAAFEADGNILVITYQGGSGNDVVLSVAVPAGSKRSTWDGGGANALWSNPQNWLGDQAPQPGNDLIFPTNAAQKVNVNDFAAGTRFRTLTFNRGGYFISGNRITLMESLFTTTAAETNTLNLDLVVTNTVLCSLGSTLRSLGAISGAGGLSVIGSGKLILAGSTPNTFQGGLTVSGGAVALDKDANVIAVPGPLVVGDSSGSDFVHVLSANQIADHAAVTVNSAGDLNFFGFITETIGPLTLRGGKISGDQATVVLGNSNVTVQAAAYPARIHTRLDLGGQPVTFNVMNGAASPDLFITGSVVHGALTKTGVGSLELNGTNTYTGATVVELGSLLVNGDNRQSDVTLSGGLLGGSGNVGSVSGTSGMTAPGASVGVLRVRGYASFNHQTTFAVELNGNTPGTDYDQLYVYDTMIMAQTPLVLILGFTPALGDTFTILRKESSGAIFGNFAGLWEGDVFQAGTNWFRITYKGGSGNDVVLTRVTQPAQLSSITPLPGGQIQISGNGQAGAAYVVQANQSLNTTNWIAIGNAVAQPDGTLIFSDPDAPSYSQRFYRFVAP